MEPVFIYGMIIGILVVLFWLISDIESFMILKAS